MVSHSLLLFVSLTNALAADPKPTVLPALEKGVIEATIAEDMSRIRRCYQKVLRENPSVAGKLVVSFTIGANGKVVDALTESSELSDPRVEACVVERFRRLRFPKPRGGGIMIVNYPFLFTPR